MFRGALVLVCVLAWASAARAGEKEPPIAGDGARAVFLRAVHARVHPTWAESFLGNAAERLPASHALNDRKHSAVVAVTLIPDGTLIGINIEQSSGSPEFDAAVLAAFPDITYPQPPDESLSDDGRAYLRWTFARDRRQCSGISVVIKESALDEAIKRLLSRRRDREAVRRVRAAGARAEEALTFMARAWLERSFEQSSRTLPAAIGLAAAGDGRGAEVLRAALEKGERTAEVTAALARLKAPGAPPPAPAPQPPQSSATLAQVLRKGDDAARLQAAVALAGRADGTARKALAGLARDRDPQLRLFGAITLGPTQRAALIAEVGSDGKEAYRALARGPGRVVAGEWLLAVFDSLLAPVQIELLSDWLWGSREASPVTLSAR